MRPTLTESARCSSGILHQPSDGRAARKELEAEKLIAIFRPFFDRYHKITRVDHPCLLFSQFRLDHWCWYDRCHLADKPLRLLPPET